jgi:hypothetical protein
MSTRHLTPQARERLADLVSQIKEHIAQGERAGIAHFRAAGEKLLEVKKLLSHGGFKPWVERNFEVSYRQCARYMNLVKAEKGRDVTFKTVAEAEHETKKPRQPKADPAPSLPDVASEEAEQQGEPESSAETRRRLYAADDPAQEEPPASALELDKAAAPAPETQAPALTLVTGAWWEQSDEAIAQAMGAHMDQKRIYRIASLACDEHKRRQFQKAA